METVAIEAETDDGAVGTFAKDGSRGASEIAYQISDRKMRDRKMTIK